MGGGDLLTSIVAQVGKEAIHLPLYIHTLWEEGRFQQLWPHLWNLSYSLSQWLCWACKNVLHLQFLLQEFSETLLHFW